jgi:hypothetical protein
MTILAKLRQIALPPAHAHRQWALLAITTMLVWGAFCIRIINIDRRPLHFDEGNNVFFGQQSPAGLLSFSRLTFDTDPPGHRFALGLWMSLAGPSPFAIRLLSVFFGVLAVAMLYRLLRMLRLPAGACLTGAVMLAISPFAIDYSQQAKGYAMGLAMALLSWWAWILCDEHRSGRRSGVLAPAIYVLSTCLLLSTHYYTAPVLLMQWLWWLLAKNHRGQGLKHIARQAVQRGIAQLIACLPIIVWVALSLDTAFTGAIWVDPHAEVLSPPVLIYRILAEMSSGQFASLGLLRAGAATLMVIMGVGTVQLHRYSKTAQAHADAPRGAFWLAASLIVTMLWSVAWQTRVHFFFPRFLLYATPCLCVFGAGCTLALYMFNPARDNTPLRKFVAIGLPASALGAIIITNLLGIQALFQAPIDAQTDYRPLFSAIRPFVKPGDAALGTYIWMKGMADSYMPENQSKLAWYFDSYAPAQVDAALKSVNTRHWRTWSFNFNRDPNAPTTLSVHWLRLHNAYAGRFSAGNLIGLLFSRPRNARPREWVQSVTFDQRIRLSYAPSTDTLSQGDTENVQLNWTALQTLREDFTIFVHVTAPDGRLVAQNDGDAINGLAPGFTWKQGKTLDDLRAVLIPDISTPGPYTIWVGLYHRGTGKRLRTSTGADSVPVGIVYLQSAPTY